jgi:soluble P-type ATPase
VDRSSEKVYLSGQPSSALPVTVNQALSARSGKTFFGQLAKRRYVEDLGASRCCCLGNGRNDRLMLKAAGLSIAVMQGEGAAVESLMAATVAAPDIQTALGLLLNPARLVATLRT